MEDQSYYAGKRTSLNVGTEGATVNHFNYLENIIEKDGGMFKDFTEWQREMKFLWLNNFFKDFLSK